MRNDFESADDFIRHYQIHENAGRYLPDGTILYMGLEFIWKEKFYRLSRGPIMFPKAPVLENGKPAAFEMAEILTTRQLYPVQYGYRHIGWYQDLEDVLDHCLIDGTVFRDIISDPDLETIGMD